jgi:hypothetical protein
MRSSAGWVEYSALKEFDFGLEFRVGLGRVV